MHHGQHQRGEKHKYEFVVEKRSEFRVHPRSKYDYPQPLLRRPMFIGDFSLDNDRKFFHDKRNLSFIPLDLELSQKVEYDLNVALDKVVRKSYTKLKRDKLNHLLQWLLLNKQKFQLNDSSNKPLQSLSTDFICYRGLLREFLCIPYEGRERFIMCATKFRGTIYLWSYETPEKKADRESQTELQLKMCSWGFKFEQYMIEDGDVSQGVNENAEYCCLLRSRLENHSLVYAGEVDGANPQLYETPHADLQAFIELKTNKEITEDRDAHSLHKFKLMKWWSQSFLVGIPTVVCGFRNADGIVQSLKSFPVEDMPYIAKDYWKSNVMMNFLNKFLTFIKQQVLVDDPQVVYKFERETAGGDIICQYLGKAAEWAILPHWYYEKMFETH